MTDPQVGQLLALASAVCFAMSNTFIGRTSQSGGDKGVVFSVMVTVVMSLALWLVFEGLPSRDTISVPALWAFALAGVCAMVFGRSLLYESVRRLGVSRASAVKRLNPFFSVLLAALILGEAINGRDTLGMVAIAAAFGLLIAERGVGKGAKGPADISAKAYMFGVFAALAYALAYILRKIGLDLMPSAAFGTLVSAVTGLAVFGVRAVVSPVARGHLLGVFGFLDRWVVLAAILMSAGQILLFAALAKEAVSTVVMIASLEVFLSIFLSVVVFRTEARPGAFVIIAAFLATLGVILVAS